MSYPTVPGPNEPNQTPPPTPPPHWPGQPAAAVPAAPVPPTRKKSKTLAILGIAVGVAVLLCCGVGAVSLIASSDDEKATAQASPAPSGTGSGKAAPAAAEPPTTPDAPSTPDTFGMKAGSTLVIESSDGTVEVTVKSFKTTKRACDRFGTSPEEGMFLIANVSVRITKGTGSINPLFFTWVADDGTTADSISGAFAGCGKALDSGNDMRTGTLRTGDLVFDVAGKKGELEYEGGLISGAAGSWRP